MPPPRRPGGGMLPGTPAEIPLGGSHDAAPAAAPAPPSVTAAPADPINIDDLDQLGPLIKSLVRGGREERYLEQISSYITKQETEIERLCNFHYQEFIASVDQLLKVRVETVDLKAQLAELSHQFNSAVKSSLDKKRELIQRRKMYANLENTIEAVAQCQAVLDLALRARTLYESKKYYSALRCLDSIRSKLLPIMQFEFAKYMNDGLPRLQDAIRTAVHGELRDWFVSVREHSRRVGQLAVEAASYRNEQRIAADHTLVVIEENEQVQVDFKPLYQAIHIYDVLGSLPDLLTDFEEQRRLQANLFLTPKFTLTKKEDVAPFTNYLHDVVGFFLIESTILSTTVQFRSRASVDLLWDQTVVNITALIQTCLSELTDPAVYLSLELIVVPFAETMQAHGYSVARLIELLSTVFERYCDLLKQDCSEHFHQLVDVDDYSPVVAKDAAEYDRYRQTVRFTNMDGVVSRTKGGFPRTLAFSRMVPDACVKLYAYIAAYYQFAEGFAAHHPVGRADLDDVARRAVDNLLVRYIHQPLITLVEGSTNLAQILQVFLNLECFERAAGEVERSLAEKRLAAGTGRVVLQATESFAQSRKAAEKRIFDLLNRKISEFLGMAEYDFMPPSSAAGAKKQMPSPYLRDLVNFLTTVMYSTLDNLPSEIKSFIYFEAFDHLATGMLDLVLAPTVRRINMAFVDQFAVDVEFLERFVNGLGDANVQDTFLVLRQAVNLVRAENPTDYLDAGIINKRYNRLKKQVVVTLLEKLNNAAGLFAHKTDKNRRKGYETVLAALKKELAEAGPASGRTSPTK
ncbi:Rab GTPase-binding exocyst subunit S15 [Blastocladiella emersonii ATCC 22665]|nr:Rab GTPase-binding exocyst subunit S15 [Blastocladiella emersonii ATCC 22665]